MVVVAGLVAPAFEDYLGNDAAEVIPPRWLPAACNKVNDRSQGMFNVKGQV
jgi:hypothetical protein